MLHAARSFPSLPRSVPFRSKLGLPTCIQPLVKSATARVPCASVPAAGGHELSLSGYHRAPAGPPYQRPEWFGFRNTGTLSAAGSTLVFAEAASIRSSICVDQIFFTSEVRLSFIGRPCSDLPLSDHFLGRFP